MSDERPPCTCLRLLGRPGRACDSCPPPAEATTHDTGPTVREAAAADRAYWEQRNAGEQQ